MGARRERKSCSFSTGTTEAVPKAGRSSKAGAEGPRRAMEGGEVTGERPTGEGLRLGGARGVWLRKRKPP